MKAVNYWEIDENFYQWEKSNTQQMIKLEDWLCMNGHLGLVRIDSKYARLFESKKIKYGSFTLFEMREFSPIRTNSIRFLMSLEANILLVLDGTNGPMYQLWDVLTQSNPEGEPLFFKSFPTKQLNTVLKDYIKFFFKNVAGRHGLFHVVDDVSELKNRVNNNYNLNTEKKKTSPHSASDWERALTDCFNLYKQHQIIENPLDGKLSEEQKSITPGYKVLNILLVFKGSLFKSNVFISTDPATYGQTSMSGEAIASLSPDEEHPGRFKIVFDPLDPDEDSTDIYLPQFPE